MTLARWVGVVVLAGCGQSSPRPVAPAAPAEATPIAKSPVPRVDPRARPAGYVEMIVVGVGPVGEGNAVVLADRQKTMLIPIMIGGTEAISISFRHAEQPFPRPTTHDLFDSAIGELDAELVRVQVDALDNTTFIGSVFLLRGERVIELDARPSDAIALAMGAKVPIYVAEKVLGAVGIKAADLGWDEEEEQDLQEYAPEEMPGAPEAPDSLKPTN